MLIIFYFLFFFFIDTAPPEIYTLSLHDALPISVSARGSCPNPSTLRSLAETGTRSRQSSSWNETPLVMEMTAYDAPRGEDRKSTRLNSSHTVISYAVFCLKKKKNRKDRPRERRC